ncbi:MAG: rRNA maturation RNase YbeY [Lachnospiraceae bacterium]|nr:rRNA maturation RNase YbeY [Lachnospiraceae bacterium]
MTIEIENEYENQEALPFDWEALLRKVVMGAMDFEPCPYEAELNILLTGNEEIHRINNEYRGIDRPTDVLSFPMIEYEIPGNFDHCEDDGQDCFNPETGELVLGDIVISVDKVLEQAEIYGHSKERELAFLTAHSMFHLFGYDHMEEDERQVMEEKQRSLLEQLGILR